MALSLHLCRFFSEANTVRCGEQGFTTLVLPLHAAVSPSPRSLNDSRLNYCLLSPSSVDVHTAPHLYVSSNLEGERFAAVWSARTSKTSHSNWRPVSCLGIRLNAQSGCQLRRKTKSSSSKKISN